MWSLLENYQQLGQILLDRWRYLSAFLFIVKSLLNEQGNYANYVKIAIFCTKNPDEPNVNVSCIIMNIPAWLHI